MCLFAWILPTGFGCMFVRETCFPWTNTALPGTCALSTIGRVGKNVPIYTAGKRDPHTAGLAALVFARGSNFVGGPGQFQGRLPASRRDRAKAVSETLLSLAEEADEWSWWEPHTPR